MYPFTLLNRKILSMFLFWVYNRVNTWIPLASPTTALDIRRHENFKSHVNSGFNTGEKNMCFWTIQVWICVDHKVANINYVVNRLIHSISKTAEVDGCHVLHYSTKAYTYGGLENTMKSPRSMNLWEQSYEMHQVWWCRHRRCPKRRSTTPFCHGLSARKGFDAFSRRESFTSI